MRPDELTPELKATTTDAYRTMMNILCIPPDRPQEYKPTQEEKQRMILLCAIRFHWTLNPEDFRRVMLALLAYKLEFGGDIMPWKSTVEFFIGPDERGN